ncbi:EutP/PduV family microcompartment system protein, partial [Escherichia coli]|uniref:EutP/PduV family microcompartment system protein n=1 Tax=Escherichia coli TaxID=562 RepID=UPI001FCED166
KTSIFSHPVYLFLRKFSLQDSRGGSLASMEHISLVKCWLREAGAHNVLVTSAVNNNGVTELFSLLHTEDVCR